MKDDVAGGVRAADQYRAPVAKEIGRLAYLPVNQAGLTRVLDPGAAHPANRRLGGLRKLKLACEAVAPAGDAYALERG